MINYLKPMLYATIAVTILSLGYSFTNHTTQSASLKKVTGTELDQYIGSSDRHVLVEFGVNQNCGRCESMKPGVVQLSETYKGKADFIHVDFARNKDLVAKYGGTVCPTYVLFEKGHPEPVFSQSFPADRDMLEAELLALLAFD